MWLHKRHKIQVIFVVGPVKELISPVKPTPQYKKWPALFREISMGFRLTDSQRVTLTPRFADKHGHPAEVDGIPEWFTDNSDVVALQPAADGKSCVVSALGALGSATITMKADARLGEGVVDLFGTLVIDVTGGEATQVTLEAGTPEEIPDEPPPPSP